MTDLERRVLYAAIAAANAYDAYARATAAWRAWSGREDLERRTPEDEAWWEANVLPAMKASWAPKEAFDKLVRELAIERATIAQEQTL
jgi:hypothetical protein